MTQSESLDPGGVEPVALVGLSCRVPGARDAERFWENLAAGAESVRFYTREEQLKMGVSPELVDDPAFVPAASVLDDIEYFDAGFFGMSGREADIADPQHRLFLELAHTALENAGYDPARYPGEVGVYTGTGGDVYLWTNVRANPRIAEAVGGLSISIGNSPDYVATLASYKLNLRGPSFALHTACSTSLVAIHLACEALRNGECDMALAGGVCIELPHGSGYVFNEGGISSPDGHCRSFDAQAAGTIWGSGGGVVVLKRLSEALADGDHIRAVVLGNAINNDGSAKVGFSAPSAEGQADVVAQAIGVAGISPRSVTYVEAHGTATALGDPIEVSALSRGYGADTGDRGWCGLGSVKSNFGHLSQAAGVVGVIKTVLSLEHGLIPPSINYSSPNPAIDFDTSPFYVNTALSTWDSEGPRRAGVSSFGIGGTNAHLILQEAPAREAAVPSDAAHLLQLSARSETALHSAVERLAGHLGEHPDLDLADVAHTLRTGRGTHAYRASVVATDPADAVVALGNKKRCVRDKAAAVAPKVAFLFSGQGSQYAGMGAETYRHEPVFAAAVNECAAVLHDELGGDLREWMFAKDDPDAGERLTQTRYTQPALFTIEYALAKLWESWGVAPAAMIGHSIGEYVAATLSGVFELGDALRLVAARGRLMQALPAGSMMAVQAGEHDVAADLPAGLSIATVNGPGTCVVAGPSDLIDAYAESLPAKKIRFRALRTSHAFHSPMMEPVLAEFTELVAAVPRHSPMLPFLSNRTGDWITAEQATDPAYWAGHLRHAVRFGDCVARLLATGAWSLVECGPGSQLASLARMQVAPGSARPLPSLPGPDAKKPESDTLYGTAGRLWCAGVPLDSFGRPGRRLPLPTYPFERAYHWVEPDPAAAAPAAVSAAPTSRILPMEQWCNVPVWHGLAPVPDTVAPARCLLFGAGPSGAALAARLRALGTEVVEVAPGTEYRKDSAGHYTVRPAERDDHATLLADLADGDGVPPRVVHAWSLADAAGVGVGGLDRGFFGLLAFAQSLAPVDLPDRVSIDVVTAGTQDVLGGDVTQPTHATVAGLLNVLPLEMTASLTMRHIDADPRTAADADALAAQVAAEVAVPPSTDHGERVAVRRGRRWAPAYEQVALPAPADGALRDGGVYLITGGLGGIGRTLAEDLSGAVGAKLVLTARTALPDRAEWDARAADLDRTGRAIAAIRRIEAVGGEVLVLAADVTDVADLRTVRSAALDTFGRLDGIVHAAGLPGGGLAELRTREALDGVLAPKVAGTLALAEVFGADDLDFVALCSSVTGVFGGIGQVDYAAASAYLDAYAHSGLGFGCPVLSLDWGGWLEVGMAAEIERPDVLKATADAAEAGLTTTPLEHPVLRVRHAAADAPGWCGGMVSPGTHWLLDEHRIAGVPVIPGTGHLETARAAVAAALPAPGPDAVVELRDVTFLSPMSVPEGSTAELRVTLEATDDGVDFQISSNGQAHVRGSGGWVTTTAPAGQDLAALRESCGPARTVGPAFYESRSGLVTFGPRWSSLDQVHSREGQALARFQAPAEVVAELDRWVLHPAMLDEATSFAGGEREGAYLPLGYGRITVHAPLPAVFWSYVRAHPGGDEVETSDIQLLDDTGRVVVDIGEFMMRRIDPDAMSSTVHERTEAAGAVGAPTDEAGIRPSEGAEIFRRLVGAELGRQVLINVRTVADSLARTRSVTTATVADQLLAGQGGAARDGDFAAPEAGLEATLAAIWSDVLGVPEVGRDDDFFELGGNSLVAVQLIAQVRKAVQVKLPMRSLFETSTVAGMAELVERLRESETPAAQTTAAPAVTIPRLARPQD